MKRNPLIVTGAAAAVALGAGVAATVALSGTESTVELDQQSVVAVDGQSALDGGIVAGRIQSKYHPLPWVGRHLDAVDCPGPLKATKGVSMTCAAEADGRSIKIPVTVDRVQGTSVTWSFER